MNESTEFEITPYCGAGPLCFGMTVEDVARQIGPPDVVNLNHLGQRTEFRSYMNVAYQASREVSLSHIGFGRQMIGVKYKGLALFKEPTTEVLRALAKEDTQPFFI